MTSENAANRGLLLNGLDGSNPLGFLALVGAVAVASDSFPELRIGWRQTGNGWRPLLSGCGADEMEFSEWLLEALQNAPTTVFDLDKGMPFEADKFSDALRDAQRQTHLGDRRDADLLVGIGTEIYSDEKTNRFQDSKLRMVRRGDSKGQGLPHYAKAIRNDLSAERIHLTLFDVWDYQDEGYSLRWDPIGDQRYALRWRDPSKSKLSDGPGTMLAADSLATEAFRWFPTMPIGRQTQTTGFHQVGRRGMYFVWPIWTPMVGPQTMRSLISLPDLFKTEMDYASLSKRGIEMVYRSQRIQQNQYYSNFAPSTPTP